MRGDEPQGRLRLGLVTIGESPQPDFTEDVREILAGVECVEHGALDGVHDVTQLRPSEADSTLITRLRNRTSVTIAAHLTGPLVDQAIERCVADQRDRVLLLCTGRVDVSAAAVQVVHAEEAAHATIAAQRGEQTLGIICPLPQQQEDIAARWMQRLGRSVITAPADPYSASHDDIVAVARELAERGVHRILLDCMRYTRRYAEAASHGGGVPVTAARVFAFQVAVGTVPLS